MVRLFLAGVLPEALQAEAFAALAAARRAASQARWFRPGQLHLTLAFLGTLDGGVVPALVEALHPIASRHPALQLWLRGAGCFGRPHQPEVLYARVAGDVDGLGTLQTDVQQALLPFLLPAPQSAVHAFCPHLTLARARGRHGDVALSRCQRSLREQLLGGFRLDRLVLFRSELGGAGARHTPLVEFPLGAGAVAHV